MENELLSSLRPLDAQQDLTGVRVFLRAALDVPISDEGTIVDTFRLQKALPTLEFLRKRGARVIIAGHASRPDGTDNATLKPICDFFNTFLPVSWVGGLSFDALMEQAQALTDGECMMLENLRFDPREKANDPDFARELASLADIYVNDAFSVAHRAHTSIVGVPQYLPAYAGVSFMEELTHLMMARVPQSPSLFVLGGAKFETKLPLVEQLLPRYDTVFIGGALANNFFLARGFEIGTSLVSSIDLKTSPILNSPKLMLPIDVVVASKEGGVVKRPDAVLHDEAICDVGPETIAMLKDVALAAETILWNGPLGDYEHGYDAGTKAFASVVAEAKGASIVGGGDTVASVQDRSVTDRFTFLSTAGGAMLTYLEAGTLPGIAALAAAPLEKRL